ncbi:hypothetical protein N7448_007735 [Penicillium atrosanguineum]|uniref:DUF1754-domain-containing protein n=1 Tax=Penicillium atrosanguineum TaxID=1132637 RepID=A0A9W9QDA7_9EURO|nr:Dehydrogenase multihelical [Penicillium atrosanguineum]KAJ5126956.1 hypothetical protein N7448_007735 [Penicillium atrosanguineum]KAJ5147162.1 hypothetical protein N7526_000514 [Penicillium atrosanguineum]KAJ5314359.1 Dehydrogenase multihelical [Penicillium atrosanguineum]KAJ5331527.1 hypothetical protein N7476_001310 [Penicillium atrosanguineum]
MAPDDYSTGGGGKLKLKGSKVSDGRVEKKKKKSLKKKEKAEQDQPTREPDAETKSPQVDDEPEDSTAKTEAERKYEAIRRKRLHERLQKEGIKTHKERVEELNKYLSRLSEHHDMPKIGPG